jgi:PAS fold
MSSVNHAAGVQRQLADDYLLPATFGCTIPRVVGSFGRLHRVRKSALAGLNYTGLSAEQAMDWGWKVAIHPEDLPRMLEIFQEAASSGQLFEAEGRLRRRDGEFSPWTIGSKAHSLLVSSVVRQLASGSSNRKVPRQKKCGSAVFQVHFLCIRLAG